MCGTPQHNNVSSVAQEITFPVLEMEWIHALVLVDLLGVRQIPGVRLYARGPMWLELEMGCPLARVRVGMYGIREVWGVCS